MQNILIIILGGLLGFLLLGSIVYYINENLGAIKYVKLEVKRADSWDEYVYWRNELRMLYWSLIPGVTPDRIKRFKRKFFSKRNKSDEIVSMLVPSIIGICLCAVCLAGGSFAWFTASQSSGTQTITSANYYVTATVKDGDSNEKIISTDGVYTLEKNKTYTFILNSSESTATNGYCILHFGEEGSYKDVCTEQFPSPDALDKKEITFSIKALETTNVRIVAQWGTASENFIENNKNYEWNGIALLDESDSNSLSQPAPEPIEEKEDETPIIPTPEEDTSSEETTTQPEVESETQETSSEQNGEENTESNSSEDTESNNSSELSSQ